MRFNASILAAAIGVALAGVAVAQTMTTTTTSVVVAPVTEASVAAIVGNAGFHDIHDIDFLEREGVWKAEAEDVSGQDFEVHVDATSGRIVHVEDD